MHKSTGKEPETQPRTYPNIGVQIPRVYLPGKDVDLSKWAVVACDQFTSQPEYWNEVERNVNIHPSTLRLTLPEVYLGKPGEIERIHSIQSTMRDYLDSGLLEPFEGMMYVERRLGEKTRRGLVLCLDLEQYDYTKGAQSLIRATEGTIVERLPPRMKIREGAPLELPHILVLIDDPGETVIEPLSLAKERMHKRYDFDLMMDSGHLSGYQVDDPSLEAQVIAALEHLADPEVFADKYGIAPGQSVLLFAMGDGNHSLATAKAIWEKIKPVVGMDHPARFALVEIENVHDTALEFEPIHRVLFGLEEDFCEALGRYYGENFEYIPVEDCIQMMNIIENVSDRRPSLNRQMIGVTSQHAFGIIILSNPSSNLAVGTLQPFLDEKVKTGKAKGIDYVHGNCVLCKLTAQASNVGFFLPHMEKSDLFKTVILDGALPRKTFSMGEAHEKRFYMEARRIE